MTTTPDTTAALLRARLAILTASLPEVARDALAYELDRDLAGGGDTSGMIEWLTRDYGDAMTLAEIEAFREGWRRGERATASRLGLTTTLQGRR